MTNLRLLEIGKASMLDGRLSGEAQVIVNADGTKPRMLAHFNDTLNELTGELILTNEWTKTLAPNYTIGRILRNDYRDALQMLRGIFVLKASIQDHYNMNIEVSFIDSSKPTFKTLTLNGIHYNRIDRILEIESSGNDDHDVFLEESLAGILNPAFEAVVKRCNKMHFINRMYYGFTLNKFGAPIDQRNRTIESICR